MENLLKKIGTESAKIIGGLTLGTALVLTPNFAEACGNKERTVLDALMPVVKNPEAIKTDADGKIYVRFNSDLNSINDISSNPEDYDLEPSDGLEPIFQTLDDALRNLEIADKYVVEIDVRDSLNPGNISNVYARNGKKLNGYSAYRCIGAPLVFK